MNQKKIEAFPRAILHVDGDSFFVSCQVTQDPSLKGRPVVTGLERGIASAMYYEAKARGITRGMRVSEMRTLCPDVVIMNSDYALYEQYSHRMNSIVKRYTSKVESYSIDECFADITGLDEEFHMTYEEIAARIKRDLEEELGITFSVGVSVTKTLAKTASTSQKPSGLTVASSLQTEALLAKTPIEKVWGIGRRTSVRMVGYAITTALDFALKDTEWVRKHFPKPYQELHHELRGTCMHAVASGDRRDYLSTSKTRTFSKPSGDESYVMAQLSNNIEKACRALRGRGMFGKKVSIFLKTQRFTYSMAEFVLPYAVATPGEILKYAERHFHALFEKGVTYRATGITVSQLTRTRASTLNLFSENTVDEAASKIYQSVDRLNRQYGRNAVFLGSSMQAVKRDRSERVAHLFAGSRFRRLGIPSLGVVT